MQTPSRGGRIERATPPGSMDFSARACSWPSPGAAGRPSNRQCTVPEMARLIGPLSLALSPLRGGRKISLSSSGGEGWGEEAVMSSHFGDTPLVARVYYGQTGDVVGYLEQAAAGIPPCLDAPEASFDAGDALLAHSGQGRIVRLAPCEDVLPVRNILSHLIPEEWRQVWQRRTGRRHSLHSWHDGGKSGWRQVRPGSNVWSRDSQVHISSQES